jgi:hypothetical protein
MASGLPSPLTKHLQRNYPRITGPVNTPARAARRRLTCMPKIAPTLLLTLVLALAALGAAGPAGAARPCWKDLVDDYWADNRVDKIYEISCYRDAMNKLPRDVEEYSDAHDDLRRALLAAIRDNRSSGGFGDGGRSTSGRKGGKGGPDTSVAPVGDDAGGGGFFREVLNKLGPKNADSVPVPLLVLASIAILLLGAAGVSYGARWLQARRMEMATSPSPKTEPEPLP